MESGTNLPAITSTAGGSGMFSLGMPNAHEMMAYQTYAKTAVESNMYRGIGKEAGVMMIMLAAREYGIGPAQALNGGLNIIEGKVELSARIMGAMIRRAKHTLKIIETTDDKCSIYGRRSDTGEEYTAEYTIQQAQRAGLIKDKGAWRKTPDDMLYARAMSKLARRLFSDVIGIGYVQGEIVLETQEVSIDLPTDIEPEIQDTSCQLEKILEKLDKDDRYLMLEFIEVVMAHCKWDKARTINEFLSDLHHTLNRFQEWKDRRLTA